MIRTQAPVEVVDATIIFVVSLLVGTAAILVGARLVVDSDAGVPNAAFTAVVGAAIWAASSVLVGWIPILGGLSMLVVWIGVINWRYAGSWGSAIAIGIVAWIVAVVVVYGLSVMGILTPDALGIPAV